MQHTNTKQQQLSEQQSRRALKLLKEGKLGQIELEKEDLVDIADEFD